MLGRLVAQLKYGTPLAADPVYRAALLAGRKAVRQHRQRITTHHARQPRSRLAKRSVYRENGDFGLTLLAHQVCNSERGNKVPSENEIRVLVSTYRRLDRGVLARFLAAAVSNVRRAPRPSPSIAPKWR
jgi:hypothetical protein